MIVIFGASGRTGSAVVARLREGDSCAVRLVTRSPGRALPSAGAEVARARLSDPLELGHALRGATSLFAMLPDDLAATAFHAERRAMADAMAKAIRAERVPRVVLLSSSGAAAGEGPGNGLGAGLAYFERAVRESCGSVSILRACYFQENVAEAIPIAQSQGVYPCLLPAPEAPIPMIAIRDVGALAARALLQSPAVPSEVVDLVGPSHAPAQVADALARALGRRVTLVRVPPDEQERLLQRGMSSEAARAMVETLQYLGSDRVALGGSRVERGTTSLDETVRGLVLRAVASAEVRA